MLGAQSGLNHLAKQGSAELRKVEARLDRDGVRLGKGSKVLLLRGLAEAFTSAGDFKAAARLWDRLAGERPDDLRVKLARFDLALYAGDDAAMKRLASEMERVEGPDGTLWRYARARRLLRQAWRGKKGMLGEARSLVAAAAERRPSWSRLAVCEAELELLSGNPGAALPAYLRAIELGERDSRVVRRLVQLLTRRGRFAEADRVLRKLPKQALSLGDLPRLAAEVSLRIAVTPQDFGQALEQARRAVAADSKDYREHVWLGQVLLAGGKNQEAEAALRLAVRLAERASDARVALVHGLVRMGELPKAKQALREAEQKLKGERGRLALARCCEAVGQLKRAEQLYRAVVDARPADVAARMSLAGFYLFHGRLRDAQPHLQRIIDLKAKAPEDAARARRTLAIALAASNNPQEAERALTVLGILDKDTGRAHGPQASIEDRKARAVVLATRKSVAERREAIRLFEELARRQAPTVEDQFFLARLHASVGDWPRARKLLVGVLADHGENPRYLAYYARALLNRKEFGEAALWVAKLEEFAPKSPTTLELKVQVLANQGQETEAVKRVQTYAKTKDARLDFAAALLEQISQPKPAGELYLQFVATSKRPERVLVRAGFLGRQGQLKEALDLCEGAWKTCPPRTVASACVTVLYASPASGEHAERVAGWLAQAERKGLTADLAAVRNLQGRYDEAERLYRQLLKRDPTNVAALNNLAWLLSFKAGRSAEALPLIQRAIQAEGPSPFLLDTRGLVYLSQGNTRAAIKDLEKVTGQAPSASRYFHLARAHERAQDRPASARALRRARLF